MSESFSRSISKSIDGVVHLFIEQVSQKYDISPEELLGIWEGNKVKTTKKSVKSPPVNPSSENISDNNRSVNELMSCTRAELAQMCADKGLKKSGTKAQLAARITGGTEEDVKKTTTSKKDAPKPATSKTSTKLTTEKQKSILDMVGKTKTIISIKLNSHGNHEHPESGLVFDSVTKKCIGKQEENGKISPLTEEDIDLCNKFKFKYVIPENLDIKKDTKTGDKNVIENIDDVINDDAEEIVEEEVEEEEIVEEEEDSDINEEELLDNFSEDEEEIEEE